MYKLQVVQSFKPYKENPGNFNNPLILNGYESIFKIVCYEIHDIKNANLSVDYDNHKINDCPHSEHALRANMHCLFNKEINVYNVNNIYKQNHDNYISFLID